MLEERDEGFTLTAEMVEQPGEREDGPTSIDVTDEQPGTIEAPPAEYEVQEQNKQIEQVQEESIISKRKQKRRITSYLSNISKQVGKQGNQINKMTSMIQSLQRQKASKPTAGVGVGQSQLQSVKQVQSQISQLQKQEALIQKDTHRIRTAPGTKARTRKRPFAIRIMPKSKKSKTPPKSKKSKSPKSIKVKRSRRIG
ncbi:MAG: hypothetical protein ACRD4J_05550 [Nitrososphaeraceae archaeon]